MNLLPRHLARRRRHVSGIRLPVAGVPVAPAR